MKRTGVGFVDTTNGIVLPLDTIQSSSVDAMVRAVSDIVTSRSIEKVIVGLPLLPSGDEGSQSTYVRECAERLQAAGIAIEFLDERYTTSASGEYDGDARAACQLLEMYVARQANL